MQWRPHFLTTAAAALLTACDAAPPSQVEVPGREPTAKTQALDAGAAMLQGTPFRDFNIHLVGFHPMKDEPSLQVEAHHFCRQVNQDFAQCALFDTNGGEAKLNGIEYIVSEQLFQSLPEDERRFWHPHNFEILSGQLVAPGIPAAAELELMQDKMNSYGKTFHVWRTGGSGHEADALPLGEPMLAWSFNRDGEVDPALVEQRDRALEIDTGQVRRQREALTPLANPQVGVNALRHAFPRETTPIEGVRGARADDEPANADDATNVGSSDKRPDA